MFSRLIVTHYVVGRERDIYFVSKLSGLSWVVFGPKVLINKTLFLLVLTRMPKKHWLCWTFKCRHAALQIFIFLLLFFTEEKTPGVQEWCF